MSSLLSPQSNQTLPENSKWEHSVSCSTTIAPRLKTGDKSLLDTDHTNTLMSTHLVTPNTHQFFVTQHCSGLTHKHMGCFHKVPTTFVHKTRTTKQLDMYAYGGPGVQYSVRSSLQKHYKNFNFIYWVRLWWEYLHIYGTLQCLAN